MSGLKQEAPEEQNAQKQDERDDDDFNQAHNRFLVESGNGYYRETTGESKQARILVLLSWLCQRRATTRPPLKENNDGRGIQVPSKV